MIDPVVSLVALALALAAAPASPPDGPDPGPSPLCPEDMRLVSGRHYDSTYHLCTKPQKGTKKVLNCYRYAEGITALEGPITDIHVCMDRFEAPNRRGAPPMVLQSYKTAGKWCAQRGKRLCTEQEWELGCEGPHHLPLAYGWGVNVRLCNSNKAWKAVDFDAFGKSPEEAKKESDRLWQGAPSGRYRTCVSPFGIYDMMGNVEEWVTSRSWRRVPGSLMGGFWAKPWTGCRGTNDAHEPSFEFYETGFRCCQEPLAAPPPDAPQKAR